MDKLKQKLEKAIEGKSPKEIAEFIWNLFDVGNRSALQKDLQKIKEKVNKQTE